MFLAEVAGEAAAAGGISGVALFGVVAVLAMALAAIGSATAQGKTAVAAMDAMWRQPEAAGNIQTGMLIALAFQEALTLFVLVVVFSVVGRIG